MIGSGALHNAIKQQVHKAVTDKTVAQEIVRKSGAEKRLSGVRYGEFADYEVIADEYIQSLSVEKLIAGNIDVIFNITAGGAIDGGGAIINQNGLSLVETTGNYDAPQTNSGSKITPTMETPWAAMNFHRNVGTRRGVYLRADGNSSSGGTTYGSIRLDAIEVSSDINHARNASLELIGAASGSIGLVRARADLIVEKTLFAQTALHISAAGGTNLLNFGSTDFRGNVDFGNPNSRTFRVLPDAVLANSQTLVVNGIFRVTSGATLESLGSEPARFDGGIRCNGTLNIAPDNGSSVTWQFTAGGSFTGPANWVTQSHLSGNSVGTTQLKSGSVTQDILDIQSVGEVKLHPSIRNGTQSTFSARSIAGSGSGVAAAAWNHSHSVSMKHLPVPHQEKLLKLRAKLRGIARDPNRSDDVKTFAWSVLGIMMLLFDEEDGTTAEERIWKMKNEQGFYNSWRKHELIAVLPDGTVEERKVSQYAVNPHQDLADMPN